MADAPTMDSSGSTHGKPKGVITRTYYDEDGNPVKTEVYEKEMTPTAKIDEAKTVSRSGSSSVKAGLKKVGKKLAAIGKRDQHVPTDEEIAAMNKRAELEEARTRVSQARNERAEARRERIHGYIQMASGNFGGDNAKAMPFFDNNRQSNYNPFFDPPRQQQPQRRSGKKKGKGKRQTPQRQQSTSDFFRDFYG